MVLSGPLSGWKLFSTNIFFSFDELLAGEGEIRSCSIGPSLLLEVTIFDFDQSWHVTRPIMKSVSSKISASYELRSMQENIYYGHQVKSPPPPENFRIFFPGFIADFFFGSHNS